MHVMQSSKQMQAVILKKEKIVEQSQKGRKIVKKIVFDLQSIPLPSEVMKQIEVDLCNLPEVYRYKYFALCINYFSKWSKANAVKDKNYPKHRQFFL